MKKRLAKKHAKAFLEGRMAYPKIEDTFLYSTDGDYCVKVVAVMPEPVWDGNHWDAPDVLSTLHPDEVAK